MKGISRLCAPALLAGLFLFQSANSGPAQAGRIAFLRGGEIWTCDTDGGEITQVTYTGGKVEEFLFSPGSKYVAYTKAITYVEEPGIWDEEDDVPQRAVCSIVIMDLRGGSIVKELMPPEHNWINPTRWLPGDRMFFCASSGFDVWGFFVYDIPEGRENELDYPAASRYLYGSYHTSGRYLLYQDEGREEGEFKDRLHLVDLSSGNDTILLAMKGIAEPAMSSGGDRVAFVQVEWHPDKQSLDHLWIHDIGAGSTRKIYTGPAKAKTGGVSELEWSPDDRYIGMLFSPEATILETADPSNIHNVRGWNFSWADDGRLIFARADSVFIHDVDTGKSESILVDASSPAYLQRP